MTNHQLIIAAVVVFCAALIGQGGHNKSLVVNGKVVPSGILQAQGRMYVDIEDLAHALGAALTQQSDSVNVTLPAEGGANGAPGVQHLSPDFQRAAISALSQMREFKGAMEAVVQQRTPIGGHWMQKLETEAQAALAQTGVAASTEGDHRALPLLQNEWAQLQTWAHSVAADRKAMNATRSISENALADDPALTRITECGRPLAQMVTSGTFTEIASCR